MLAWPVSLVWGLPFWESSSSINRYVRFTRLWLKSGANRRSASARARKSSARARKREVVGQRQMCDLGFHFVYSIASNLHSSINATNGQLCAFLDSFYLDFRPLANMAQVIDVDVRTETMVMPTVSPIKRALQYPPSAWTAEIHPLHAEVIPQVESYFLQHWPFPNDRARKRFLAAGFSRVTCLYYPKALNDRIHFACRLLTLLFLVDGVFNPIFSMSTAVFGDFLMLTDP